jgi:hypothetical protein
MGRGRRQMKGVERPLHSVFDHAADPATVDALHRAIVEEVCRFRQSHLAFGNITADRLGIEEFGRLKEKFDPLLHFRTFNLPEKRDLAQELIWKATEATGKYTGCQFWSVRAKALFDQNADWAIGLKTAKALEKTLSLRTREKSDRLTHEHVYPIKDLKLQLCKIGPTLEKSPNCSKPTALPVWCLRKSTTGRREFTRIPGPGTSAPEFR